MTTTATRDHAATVHALMPELTEQLAELVRIPSISGANRPSEPLERAHDLAAELLRTAGAAEVRSIELPDTAPVVYAHFPGPAGAPTVLLYSHYDVVSAENDEEWASDPFEPVVRDGAMFGRGTADTKSNIVMHLGSIRAWGGELPVTVKVVLEGEEEVGGGAIDRLPELYPDIVDADVIVIGDGGNERAGVPTFTTSLRGMATVVVEARTIASPQHSGMFGGAAPDALLALVHALATLHDERGALAVEGLLREPWTGAAPDEAEYRELGGIPDDLPLMGDGDLGSRIWSGPSITVIGMDTPSVAGAVNAVQPAARAKLNVRVAPHQDATEAADAVVRHLTALRPFGVQLTTTVPETGNGFAADTEHPAYAAARTAWSAAFDGAEVTTMGVGGSIPLVTVLQEANPGAAVFILGACDGHANIHGPNERVLLDELERSTVAQATLFGLLAGAHGSVAR